MNVLHETVAESMKAFEPMLSTLTGYARAMTGNADVLVEVGHKTQTDGKRIMVRPPLALASLPEHERRACGDRLNTGELACAACAAREDILVKMRHELGHILHGSFERLRPTKAVLTQMAEEYNLSSAAIPAGSSRAPLMTWAKGSRDPNIPTLVMALEDVRIDRANASTSDGGAAAYRSFLERSLVTGGDHGVPALEHPLNGQVLLGLLTVPHGVDVEGLISDEALEVLRDGQVSGILSKQFPGPGPVLQQAFALYRRLIDLGVFPDPEPAPEPEESEKAEPQEQDESEPEQDGQDQQDGQGEQDEQDEQGGQGEQDGQGEQGQSDGQDEQEQGESGEQEKGSPEGDGDPGDSGDPAAGAEDSEGPEAAEESGSGGASAEPMDPRELRKLVEAATGHDIALDGKLDIADGQMQDLVGQVKSQVEHLGDVGSHFERVNLYGRRRPDGRGPLFGISRASETTSAQDPTEALIGSLVGRARIVFFANAMTHRQRDAVRGRVSPTTLGKRAWNPDEQRLFERRQRNDAPSYSVLIGMDNSGSTVNGTIAKTLRETSLAAATMCQRVGVEVSMYAHTTGHRSMDLYELKAPEEPWNPSLGDDLRKLNIGSTNYDGSTLRAYRRILERRRATRKVLLYFTDGYIPGAGGAPEELIMHEEVVACQRRGITLLGVGAHTSSPEDFGIPTVRLDKVEDVRRVLEFLAKEFGV